MNKYTLIRLNKNRVEYNGICFNRDLKTGYYLSSRLIDGKRPRLHRYVYELETGNNIPNGFHVHHKDHNKDNNDISNLILLSEHDHEHLHAHDRMQNHYELIDNWHNAGIAVAPKWHRSKEGSQWHRKHWEKMQKDLYKTFTFKCKMCGKSFTGHYGSAYCSNKCKSAYRRKYGLDDVERECLYCGKKFRVNKYSKVKCCCRSHSALLWRQSKKS
ncbi:HNH endonuclease (plasmid) [Fructilactobacillus ixorae]|uniref:HNH endonuclease n=1 Tax=Fructilactobacillus ixorae TaxID=1750535 RepID=A0ABY5C5E6_9LACO|nr:HNH endonuclease signature motif containing protein [Fructilactobacillus ixorae]USS93996.1 HNH endonuclease [Fructilactobacillus ixorae]